MSVTDSWFKYEQYVRYLKYLEAKKYKTSEEREFELYARDVAKLIHDSIMSIQYPGNGPVA